MSYLITNFLNFLENVVNMLPTIEIPETAFGNMVSGMASIVKLLVTINFVFPVDIFLAPVAVIAAIKFSLFLFWLGNWVYNRITQQIP